MLLAYPLIPPASDPVSRLAFTDYIIAMWHLASEGGPQGVGFWIVVYAFAVCAYSLAGQWRSRRWPDTRGELAESGVKHLGGSDYHTDQDHVTNVRYHYRVQGMDYIGNRVSPWVFVTNHNARGVLQKQLSFMQHLPDGGVKVFYNPARPQKSFLVLPGRIGMMVTAAAGLLPAVWYGWRFHGG